MTEDKELVEDLDDDDSDFYGDEDDEIETMDIGDLYDDDEDDGPCQCPDCVSR